MRQGRFVMNTSTKHRTKKSWIDESQPLDLLKDLIREGLIYTPKLGYTKICIKQLLA